MVDRIDEIFSMLEKLDEESYDEGYSAAISDALEYIEENFDSGLNNQMKQLIKRLKEVKKRGGLV